MRLINQLSKVRLYPKDVYTFSIKLCDNEIDNDFERFTAKTLAELEKLFIGKCGVLSQSWSDMGQTARIYRTELVRNGGLNTKAGDDYFYLRGLAYIARSEKNANLIAEIESGTKKEVSVGCSVNKCLCSICGEGIGKCAHVKGEWYGGKLCWTELTGATNAYEWSFVATPVYVGAIGRDGTELWRRRMH